MPYISVTMHLENTKVKITLYLPPKRLGGNLHVHSVTTTENYYQECYDTQLENFCPFSISNFVSC